MTAANHNYICTEQKTINMAEYLTIAEVRNDYRDDETGKYFIDVYLTEDDDEEGFSVATVDADGNVDKFGLTRIIGYDLDPVFEAIEEAKEKQAEIKQELIDKCLNEIRNDVASGDVTAIDELLKFVPSRSLQAYLPE